MTGEERISRDYMVSVRRLAEGPLGYRVSYVDRGMRQQMRIGEKLKRVPEYTATVYVLPSNNEEVQWDRNPNNSEATQKEFDDDARRRVHLLNEWLGTLTQLIVTIRSWAKDLDWSTREIDKPMEESEIGNHRLPALLMQRDATKVLLEPVARSASGTEGVVDLYLMPGYDDIASMYFYNDRWNLHYLAPGPHIFEDIREKEAKPLTKANFRKVLDEMKQHAQ